MTNEDIEDYMQAYCWACYFSDKNIVKKVLLKAKVTNIKADTPARTNDIPMQFCDECWEWGKSLGEQTYAECIYDRHRRG